jgi:L-lactate dehydrogenase
VSYSGYYIALPRQKDGFDSRHPLHIFINTSSSLSEALFNGSNANLSIHAYVLGEHGDSSFPVLSSANIAGVPLLDFSGFTPELVAQCYQETKTAAYRIIHDMGYTCYSIGIVIKEIMSHIFQHSRVVLPLSVKLNDYYGHCDVALSVPCVLDSNGVAEVIKVPLNDLEQNQLANSVGKLKQYT